MSTLKPCPFCGSKAVYLLNHSKRPTDSSCEFNGNWTVAHDLTNDNFECILAGNLWIGKVYQFKHKCIEAWNHREGR